MLRSYIVNERQVGRRLFKLEDVATTKNGLVGRLLLQLQKALQALEEVTAAAP